jgi:hypothetical protein
MKTPKEIAAEMVEVLRQHTQRPFSIRLWHSRTGSPLVWVAIEATDNHTGRAIQFSKSNHFDSTAIARKVETELQKLQQ